MMQIVDSWIHYAWWGPIIRTSIIALIAFPLLWISTKTLRRILQQHMTLHVSIIISKIYFYAGLVFTIATILNTLGFKLTALLGAAGVLGIAIGFAARTSVSNILSGIFLLLENSFSIGDVLEYSTMSGVVQSINLFSVQLRTFSGKLVRIPNESILQNMIINTSYFKNRRIAIQITIAKNEYASEIQDRTLSVVKSHAYILDDPAPTIFIENITYFSVILQLRCWTAKEHVPRISQELMVELHQMFQKHKYMVAIHPL